ncbi:unnamed protein product [Adineta steineri]|uniref:Uncharacterized protein n=1 Tax=Adineta steineri TaxID=433720 RepID=A0A816BII1_9BILA|nr:unnamed protein product [Adineta steineri]CAF1610640.1 unnamed protein product [Adineta steineri]
MNNSSSPSIEPSTTKVVFTAARSRLVRAVHELNLYSDHPFWSPTLTYAEQLFNTRLFIFFVSISLLIVIICTSLNIRTHEVTLEKFSLNKFEQLEDLHPFSINVPCTQLSIPYNKFINLSPQFHQVCSSPFISQKWISSLFLPNATSHHLLDFRTFTFAQFRTLALFCRTARRAVTDAQHAFASTHLVTSHALSRAHFLKIMDVIVTNFKHQVKANERRTAAFVSLSIAENRVFSALRTNYYVQSVPSSRSYLTINGVYSKKNTTVESNCFCRLEGNRCISPAGIFDKWTPPVSLTSTESILTPRIQIPGLMAGCLPFDSMRQSTLECLYNQSCVNILTLQPQLSRPKALNASISRFLINETIESMFDQSLFLESWHSTSNFEKYFAACAPRSLSYSYEDRFYFSTIFTICVSAFGGLILAWQLITPAIVKVWKRIIWKRRRRHPTIPLQPRSIEEAILSVAPRPLNEAVIAHAHQTIYTFNLFSSDDDNDPEEERVGIIATRLYILFLLLGLLILGFYTSVTTHTDIDNIPFPTLEKFEELHSMYSSSLECPCTHMSMSYARIMSIIPRYHQVCSSEFLEDYWLSYFGLVHLDGTSNTFLTSDFRVSGQSFFELLNIFCKAANETVQNALDVFRSTRLFTAHTISREEFHLQTSARMQQFEQHIISSFLNIAELVHSSIETNRLITEMLTSDAPKSNFNNQTSTWSLGFRPRRLYTNSCSCALSNQCTRPIGFYLQSDTVRSQPNVTIPGLLVGCYPIDSFLLSTLECLYDRQCLKLIVDMYDFDVVNLVQPLDKRVLNISPLHYESSRFHPNNTMKMIYSQLFVEEWMTSSDYINYYIRCAPTQCTYKVMRRFDIPYMVTIMLGFCGGLSVVLEVILPPIVKIIRQCWKKRIQHPERQINTTVIKNTSVNANNEEDLRPVSNVFQRFWSFNLFSSEILPTDKQLEHQEIVATRIYFLLIFFCLVSAFLYASPFTEEIDTTIIALPTSDIVNNLHAKNISTLSCPCSTAAVSYSKFLRIIPHYHPICSSQLTSPSYWFHFFNKTDDISLQLSAQYRLLASLCNVSRDIIENRINIFGTRELISIETATRSSFYAQTNALVTTFITRIPADFRRTLSFTIDSFGANQLLNVFSSNWQVRFTSENEYYLIGTHPRRFSSSNCSCATSSDCREQLAENVFSGCFIFDGFRLSKFENFSMTPLISKLFVESWQNESNYTAYFETCRPMECRYTLPDRNNFIYILTTVLGVYAGLRYALHLIIGQILLGYRWWTKHIRRRQQMEITGTEPMTL